MLGPGGAARPARDALREHGLDEFALGPKEGIALLAGIPGATALCVQRYAEAMALASRMEAAAALSITAAGAPGDPYLDACARGDEILGQVLRRLRQATGGIPGLSAPQAPVSFRVAGPVLTHLLRSADRLASATDAPLPG